MKQKLEKLLLGVRHCISSHIYTKPIQIKLNNPIISFTFDDVPRTAFENGAGILEKYNCKGTFYVAGNLCSSNSQYINHDQIKALLGNGHEIGCHTFSHVKTGSCKPAVLQKELLRNQEYMRNNFLDYGLSNFSYPNGSIGIWNKPLLSQMYMSLRSTCPGINYGTIDLNTLLAYKLYSSKITLQEIDRLIESAKSRYGWLIFYTHDVCPKPSRIGCTPELLEYAVRVASESGAEIMNIKQAVCKIRQASAKNQS